MATTQSTTRALSDRLLLEYNGKPVAYSGYNSSTQKYDLGGDVNVTGSFTATGSVALGPATVSSKTVAVTETDERTLSWTGPWASLMSPTCYFSKTGTQVQMTLGLVSSATNSSAAITIGAGAIPATFRPSANFRAPLLVLNNSTFTMGNIQVGSDGSMSIYKDLATTPFDNAANAGWSRQTVSWYSPL